MVRDNAHYLFYTSHSVLRLDYGLNDRGIGVRFPTGILLFAAASIAVLGAHPAPFSTDKEALSPEVKR
jgi:hypothetical protein